MAATGAPEDTAGRLRRRRPFIRIYRRHPNAVLVDAVTLLNQELSPTARLTYAVLAADQAVDEDNDTFDMDRISPLVGLADSDALQPVLAELIAVGATDKREHHGMGLVLSVNLEAIHPASQQPCVPCDQGGQQRPWLFSDLGAPLRVGERCPFPRRPVSAQRAVSRMSPSWW